MKTSYSKEFQNALKEYIKSYDKALARITKLRKMNLSYVEWGTHAPSYNKLAEEVMENMRLLVEFKTECSTCLRDSKYIDVPAIEYIAELLN